MEDILDLYQQPYNPQRPLICVDEKPVQLIKDTREPLPPKPGRPKKVDYEYERNGTASIFMHTEPLGSWRHVSIRPRRTKKDWASEIKDLLEVYYPEAERIILVCDNLNTHRLSPLYEAFPAEEARKLARRLEIHYTPKHGSWLNIAEIELSALTKQCLSRRIGDIQVLAYESQVWEKRRNELDKNVDWQFTTKDARIRLKHIYPLIQN
jgi:hypothetical protein